MHLSCNCSHIVILFKRFFDESPLLTTINWDKNGNEDKKRNTRSRMYGSERENFIRCYRYGIFGRLNGKFASSAKCAWSKVSIFFLSLFSFALFKIWPRYFQPFYSEHMKNKVDVQSISLMPNTNIWKNHFATFFNRTICPIYWENLPRTRHEF